MKCPLRVKSERPSQRCPDREMDWVNQVTYLSASSPGELRLYFLTVNLSTALDIIANTKLSKFIKTAGNSG